MELLLSSLGGEAIPQDSIPGVCKKMRDEVQYENGAMPWRRAPIWAALKGVMHFVCVHSYCSESSKQRCMVNLPYKLLIQNFLTWCLEKYLCKSTDGIISDSAKYEACKKLVRRLVKLEKKMKSSPGITNGDLKSVEEQKQMTVEVCRNQMAILQEKWKKACAAKPSTKICPQTWNVDEDVVHKLPNSGRVLDGILERQDEFYLPKMTGSRNVSEPASFEKVDDFLASISKLLNGSARLEQSYNNWKTSPHDVIRVICELESAVSDLFPQLVSPAGNQIQTAAVMNFVHFYITDSDYPKLLKLQNDLMRIGLQVFENDPRGCGMVALIAVSICALVDIISCVHHPMLQQHKLGIDSTMLHYLYLSTKKQKQHLHLVEKYINWRNTSRFPATTEPCRSTNSFAVRFAAVDSGMQQVRQQIQEKCRINQTSKRQQLEQNMQRYRDLGAYVRNRGCSCSWYHNGYRSCKITCERCHKNNEMNEIKLPYYEKLLPPGETEQKAVVFELQQPDALIAQREAIISLAEKLCGEQWYTNATDVYRWRHEFRLDQWRRSGRAMTSTMQAELGSERKKFSQSHYRGNDHVTSHPTFIVDHDYATVLMGPGGPVSSGFRWDIRPIFKVALPVGSCYKHLEQFINKWDHNENQVIALKSEASEKLSLPEFEKVGTLRAGGKLQWARLASSLQQNDMSFQCEEVVSFVNAAIQQAGPSGENWHRQSCELLQDDVFVKDVCEKLEEVLTGCSENWANQNVLLNVISIAQALFEHGQSSSSPTEVLRKCRTLAKEWIEKLMEASNNCGDEDEMQKIRARIVDISVMGTLTFADDDKLLKSSDDMGQWIYFRAIYNDNYSPKEVEEASWRRRWILHAYVIAERVFRRVHSFVLNPNNSELEENGLSKFLYEYWSASRNKKESCIWTSYRRSSPWFHADFRTSDNKVCKLQVDVMSGAFLVDGSPCKALPRAISSHKVYQRLFGNSMFNVQPTGSGGYRTSMSVNGFFFEFYEAGASDKGGPTIIKERQSDGVRLLLIPEETFNSDIPEALVQNYSHWLALRKQANNESRNKDAVPYRVYFRPVKYNSENFTSSFASGSGFVLNCITQEITEIRTGLNLIDVHSKSFKELYSKVFCRLAPELRVHVFKTEESLFVDLPKLNLRFDVDLHTGLVVSREYGLAVAEDQNKIKTLIGLEHGVLLSDVAKNVANDAFLIPNGKLYKSSVKEDQNGHGSVSVDVATLRSPACFKYEVRREMWDLHGTSNRLSWFFLANLHAYTSGLLPDPFTQTTGYKRALDILRSGRCCGNVTISIDDESATKGNSLGAEKKLLNEIASISPERENYHAMERNDLHTTPFHAVCALPAYAYMVTYVISQGQEVMGAIGKGYPQLPLGGRLGDLSRRAYILRKESYAKDALLTPEEEDKTLNWKSGTQEKSTNSELGNGFDKNLTMQLLGCAHQNGQVLGGAASIVDLLCSPVSNLHGCRSGGVQISGITSSVFANLQPDDSLDSGKVADFRHVWLKFYEIARSTNPKDIDKKAAFAQLILWTLSEYPNESAHLQQLMMVWSHATTFPTAPRHTQYTKPNEYQYDSYDISAVVEKHLSNFSESYPEERSYEPFSEYSRRVDRYEDRKREHERSRRNSKQQLENSIRNSWDTGATSVSSCQANVSLVTNSYGLANEISSLFTRWRQAIELRNFATKVNEIFDGIRNGTPRKLQSVPFLSRSCGKDIIADSKEFQLVTQNTPLPGGDPVEIENALLRDSIGQLSSEGHWRSPVVPGEQILDMHGLQKQGCQGKTRNKLELDNRGSEYEEMWNSLKMKLKQSWKLAQENKGCEFDAARLYKSKSLLKEMKADLDSYLSTSNAEMNRLWSAIECKLKEDDDLEPQTSVGLWNEISPRTVLQNHLLYQPSENLDRHRDSVQFHDLVLAFGVMIRHVQRARRCLRLLKKGSSSSIHLFNDLRNPGCGGWKPKEYPEFLAFEIDNDMCIREIQAKVAFEILDDRKGNRLLQLNMGDGKTAVIMPLVLAVAARGSQIVRATVLSQLYGTNAGDWQYKLGGFLGRRIYPLLCRRDLRLNAESAEKMLELCKKIMERGDIIVTVPEHRLSLENKALELASSESLHKDLPASHGLHKVIEYLNQHGREFLDESDEILSPKYQLIYTLGCATDMDGGPLRWAIHSLIYECVGDHAYKLQEEFGSDTIEILLPTKEFLERPEQYAGLRLLDSPKTDQAYEKIKRCIIDDIKGGRTDIAMTMTPAESQLWNRCVNGESISTADIESLPPKMATIAWALRGVLSQEVLKMALQKRWRVHYGVHPTRKNYQMAVPYRAKDVAAERTEFGHPDMALSLTFTHYYNAGLDKEEMKRVFEKLSRMSDSEAKAIYRSFTALHDESDPRIEGVRSYEGVNLEDHELFEKRLYPAFRKNIKMIKFFLTKLILPVQAKQFPTKLLATAPDLCRSTDLFPQWKSVTTGFSGTDDLSVVLPWTIEQKNLPELESTNGVQLMNLLREENNFYEYLQTENTAQEIIEKLVGVEVAKTKQINVVLDAGALVLQMSNGEFMENWLRKRSDMEAGVYFNGDKIFVMLRNGQKMPLDVSPYADDMSKCLLYLDDIHTRGSDFRLPLETRAVLTLGKDMPKDKFVQACMRMRQLGKGQSLTFVASAEVNLTLKSDFFRGEYLASDLGYVKAILNWTLWNTSKKICDLTPYFVDQFTACARKGQAYTRWEEIRRKVEQCRNCFDDIESLKAQIKEKLKLLKTSSKAIANLELQQTFLDNVPVAMELLEEVNHMILQCISTECLENEILTLSDMYGHKRGIDSLPNIIARQLKKVRIDNHLDDVVPMEIEDEIPTSSTPTMERDDSCSSREFATPPSNNLSTSSSSRMTSPNSYDTVQSRTPVQKQPKSLGKMVAEIKQHVQTLAPRVQRNCSMFDEEQERELEQELEEETQVERPPPATPKTPFVSDELKRLLTNQGWRQALSQGITEYCEDHFVGLRQMFAETTFLDTMEAHLQNSNVYVTHGFCSTVEGSGMKNAYMKNIRWFLKFEKTVIIVSNFEAEYFAEYLDSALRKNQEAKQPRLYAFAPMTRLQQPRKFLTKSSYDPPALVHLFAGSVHPDEKLYEEIKDCLAICPRPLTPGMKQEAWDECFNDGLIERDGFVRVCNRELVISELGLDETIRLGVRSDCLDGPFDESVLKMLKDLYSNSRHLADELAVSVVGKLLGVSEDDEEE